MDSDFQNYKLKSTQEITMCKEKVRDLNNLQDVATSLTTAKSCWQLGMQGITRSGKGQFFSKGLIGILGFSQKTNERIRF